MASTDGVAVDYVQVSALEGQLPMRLGHWLGLIQIWGIQMIASKTMELMNTPKQAGTLKMDVEPIPITDGCSSAIMFIDSTYWIIVQMLV
ncbi:MAG: hypothetical protein IPN09_15710 [Bacteroidetes bacterium]|nr:hypothetical protein [Bacteroidota bacterium]